MAVSGKLPTTGEIYELIDSKIAEPSTEGTNGQVLTTDGNGGRTWSTVTPTDTQVNNAVSDWLDSHPEATTTVQDGSITYTKLDSSLKGKADDVSTLKNAYYAIGTEQDFSYLSSYRDGYYIKNDGTTEEENGMLAHTDYIEIPTNAISVTCGNRTSNNAGTSTYRVSPNILFYDVNKTFISYDVADASITKPTYNIPSGAKYCIINQPSASAKAAAGIGFIRFNSSEINSGFVGMYAGAFTAASQQIQTGIQLKAGVLYSIVVNTAITARINIFPHADSSKMIRAFAPGSYPLCVTSDTTLDLYNGTYGYTGSISVNVLCQGYIDNAMTKVPMVYEVGGTSPLQSFTALLLALKNDDREKIIYINGGDYDIFQEYTDLGLLSGNAPADPTHDYFDSNVWIPRNTHIIGRGIVRLMWQPTTSQISAAWSQTISPINAAGTMTLENVEIHVKNGRYCIHDDPLGKGAYTGARKTYRNVKCYKYLNDSGYGFNPVIGCGIDREMYYEFDKCLFKSEANQNAFYMHNRAGTEDMPSLTKSLSSNVVVKDCIMITTGRGVALGNVGNSSAQRIRADFYNCYITGTFNVGDESAYTSGNNSNVFDITLNQCTAPTILIADPNNIYPANVYN